MCLQPFINLIVCAGHTGGRAVRGPISEVHGPQHQAVCGFLQGHEVVSPSRL